MSKYKAAQRDRSTILQLRVGQKGNTYGRSAKLLMLEKKLAFSS